MPDRGDLIARMATAHAAAWTRNDARATAELFSEDATLSVNGAEPHVGRAALIESAQNLMDTFPGVVVHVRETRASGNRAVFTWTLEGEHSETGRHVVLPGWHEWELDTDLKVRVCRGFYDAEDLEQQVSGTTAS